MKKRLLSLLLALVLCIGLLPAAVSAAVAEQSAIQSNFLSATKTYSTEDGYHYVYFGQWNGKPIKWRVLTHPESYSDPGALLLADEVVDTLAFGKSDDDYLWASSQAKEWCNDTFYNGAFSALEQARISDAPETNDRATTPAEAGRNTADSITTGQKYQEYLNILNGDKIFFPSWLDLFNTDYGFAPDGTASYAAQTARTAAPDTTTYYGPGGTAYWLRSYLTVGGNSYAGKIDELGAYQAQASDIPSGARPMLYLQTGVGYVYFVTAAAGGKSADGMDDGLTAVLSLPVNEWKLTLKDESRDGKFKITGRYSSGDYLYLDYEGAATGENEYVSGHIFSNPQQTITHYGRLGKVTDSSGTVKIAKSIFSDGDWLYIYNEQYNGDYRTDYVGGVNLIDRNNTTPVIDVTSELTGLSTDGKPYSERFTTYTATLTPEQGYMLPESITVTAGGTELVLGKDYRYDPETGELKVWVSQNSGALHITVNGVKKTWKISVSPEDGDFGTIGYGYDPSPEQVITITNTGNQTLTMESPEHIMPNSNFEVALGSAYDSASGQAVLAPGESATFTVRLKAGLDLGTYSDMLILEDATGKVRELMDIEFTVQETIVNISDIHGVTAPVTGEPPAAAILDTEQYTGTVTWSPSDAAFAAGTQYTATITLTPKYGYTLTGVPENFFAVSGATCTNAADSGVITAEFPAIPSNSRQTNPVNIDQSKHGKLTADRPSAPAGVTVTVTAKPDGGYELNDLTVVDRNGDAVDAQYEGDGQYSFRMPVGGVSVSAEFTARDQYGSFGDVARGEYYFDAVEWAAEQGILDGVGGGLFAPHSACTRAQIVTILYRLEGTPAASANPFRDVASGSYYEKAVAWAAENGIVNGYGNGLFGPNDRITREQLAAILYRYAQYKKLDVSVGEDTNILSYNDATSISDYAFPAMQWACGAGLLKGANGDLLPKNTATRAQTATILYRLASLLT